MNKCYESQYRFKLILVVTELPPKISSLRNFGNCKKTIGAKSVSVPMPFSNIPKSRKSTFFPLTQRELMIPPTIRLARKTVSIIKNE